VRPRILAIVILNLAARIAARDKGELVLFQKGRDGGFFALAL
jgi:hypothetical protein